jgi:uncharacterized protein (DUF2147 family)
VWICRSLGLAPGFLLRQEVMMKRLLAIAAFLLASSTAQAQYTFEYGGHTIRIDPDRGTVSIPGVYDNTGTPKKAKRPHNNQENARSKQGPQDARSDVKSDPQATPAPAPADTAAAPAATPPAAPAPGPANTAAIVPNTSTTTANNAPGEIAVAAPRPPPAPASPPPLLKESVPSPRAEPSPTVAAVPPPMPAPPSPASAAARDPNSPVGVWLTEEKEGKVRIEQCGINLCGYSVDTKSNLNGEQVLINMRPGKDQKWSGRILDPNTGSTYDSTIALKGSDTLRVQGCAFGGMFCGGQTWTRVN